MNMDDKNKKDNNNTDDDIEMGDACNNNNNNQCNYTQTDIHIKNNIFESIGSVNFRRMTEMPKSNYNLNYNCDNMTKGNGYFCSDSKNDNIQTNNNNNNLINQQYNCYNINNKNNCGYKQLLSSKEKPNLSLLPLMNTNQIRNNNNIYGFHRSRTDNNITLNSNVNNYNNSQEINKWLMRI